MIEADSDPNQSSRGLRESLLRQSLLAGWCVALGTELLSALGWINRTTASGFCVVCLALLVWPIFTQRRRVFTARIWRESWLYPVAILVVVLGVTAVVAPPNTSDALTYHLPRVRHWIQNHHVGFYPTSLLRQLHQLPFAEYCILQLHLLAGSDRLANLPQFFSLCGSLLAVSLIARELGAARRGQWLAVILCLTLPMGVLQASSAQNDYVAAFWLAQFVFWGLRARRTGATRAFLLAFAALGLALFTKATGYLFAFPIALWLVWLFLRHQAPRRWGWLAVFVLLAFAPSLPQFARNARAYGAPLGPGREGPAGMYEYRNQRLSLAVLTENLIRNTALHLTLPLANSARKTEWQIRNFIFALGYEPDDPASTWTDTHFALTDLAPDEDRAGNPVHLIAFLIAVLLLFMRRPRPRIAFIYLAALLAGYVLFCLYLRWQPWHSRLHLPLFVLASPLVGYVFAREFRPVITHTLAIAFMLAALPFALFNISRPLAGPESILTHTRRWALFLPQPYLERPDLAGVGMLGRHDWRDIGLYVVGSSSEYPFWFLLDSRFGAGRYTLEHTGPDWPPLPWRHKPFDAIISDYPKAADTLRAGGDDYVVTFRSYPVTVYVPRPANQ